ncbi:hypothetical protein EJB05_14521 [Eragrostis curvula]|uniref:Uncharacterized protein n=1 Tax=Eragrostis curvula TaxID=38414 RepID=A0A5J9VZF8_9POAL|nr:hypothetical protein EJB05_14485 [Eragrostis curvula]TVU41031.1 hypothetical protein EJB05_14521 [Eragrostis curvula]
MALRYLARKVGIPGLRRALGPRVSPAAVSRPLPFSTSQGGAKGAGKEIDEDIARLKAGFEAQREAFRKSVREEQRGRRMMIGSGAAGLVVAALVCEYH